MPTPLLPHILAVNHYAEVLELFGDILRDAGYRVTTGTAGGLDLPSVLHLAPDLIVLDAMWFADDWPLLQSLAIEPWSRAIPVVLCTIPMMTAETLVARLDGMTIRMVPKPYSVDDLLSEIHAALDNVKAVA